jgi:beta-glucosidase
MGAHAPGATDPAKSIAAAHHLLLGHGLAVGAMRSRGHDHQFGITLNLSPTDPASDGPEDVDAARRADGLANRLFLDPLLKGTYPADLELPMDHVADGDLETISADLDFLGVNYYFRTVVRKAAEKDGPTIWPFNADIDPIERGLPKTEMGWEIDADGLYDILTRVAREYPGIPLYVTENGAAFADVKQDGAVHDPDRVEYLRTHFGAAQRAIADGVDLRGYFVWSLLDNFEWAYGFSKRFGLIHVDYETLERTPKDSARFYAQVTRANALPE